MTAQHDPNAETGRQMINVMRAQIEAQTALARAMSDLAEAHNRGHDLQAQRISKLEEFRIRAIVILAFLAGTGGSGLAIAKLLI